MDIVLALHQFPPFGGGGTEVLAQWIAHALRAKGHSVSIVSAIPRKAAANGVPLPPRDVVRFLHPPAWPDDSASRIRREYDDETAGDAFGALLDERRPHVVHFLHLAGLTASALRATTDRGIPAIFTATDFWFECPTVQLLLCDHSRCEGPGPYRLNCARHLMEIRHPTLSILSALSALDRPASAALRFIAHAPGLRQIAAPFEALAARSPALRTALRSAAAIIAPTAYMRERLTGFGVAKDRLHLVRYGVPGPATRAGEPATPGTRGLRIGYIGTLAAHKGPHLLVEALALLRDASLHLDLHGDVAETDYCRSLLAASQTDPRIRLCGRFAPTEIGTVLANTDVLVIPALWDENAPLVLLQAIAHRCPVIVSNVPGHLELMREQEDGWSFKRNDARDLAAVLGRLAAEPALLAPVRQSPAVIGSVEDHIVNLLAVYERCNGAPAHTRL